MLSPKTIAVVKRKGKTPPKKRKRPLAQINARKRGVWKLFSAYIRQKYADKQGYVRCVTCKAIGHWKTMQAGHFIPGRGNSILFEEKGVHPQCFACNIWKHGNLIEYYEFMLETYGKKTIDELKELNKKTKQFTVKELDELKQKYS